MEKQVLKTPDVVPTTTHEEQAVMDQTLRQIYNRIGLKEENGSLLPEKILEEIKGANGVTCEDGKIIGKTMEEIAVMVEDMLKSAGKKEEIAA